MPFLLSHDLPRLCTGTVDNGFVNILLLLKIQYFSTGYMQDNNQPSSNGLICLVCKKECELPTEWHSNLPTYDYSLKMLQIHDEKKTGLSVINCFIWSVPEDGGGRKIDHSFLTLQGHKNSIFSIRYCKVKSILASCGREGIIKLWNL